MHKKETLLDLMRKKSGMKHGLVIWIDGAR